MHKLPFKFQYVEPPRFHPQLQQHWEVLHPQVYNSKEIPNTMIWFVLCSSVIIFGTCHMHSFWKFKWLLPFHNLTSFWTQFLRFTHSQTMIFTNQPFKFVNNLICHNWQFSTPLSWNVCLSCPTPLCYLIIS